MQNRTWSLKNKVVVIDNDIEFISNFPNEFCVENILAKL